jgi:hypothetical protein
MHATTQQRHLIDTRSARAFLLATTIFAAGAALGATAAVVTAPAARGQTVIVAGDRRYDAIEESRANSGLTPVAGDRRYDAIEESRANSGLTLVAGDRRYDAVEEMRAGR